MKKNIVPTLLLVLSVLISQPCCGQDLPVSGDAVAVIETLNRALVDCMKRGEELGYSGRYDLRKPVMTQSFYFSYMVRKSTGSSWKTLTAAQQKTLIETYITWSVGRYAERFKKYKGQKFLVVSSAPFLEKYRQVVVRIIKQDGSKRELNYLLADHKGSWLIVDIRVDGVSQLSLTRAQFRSILKDQGIDGLLKVLQTKIDNRTTG